MQIPPYYDTEYGSDYDNLDFFLDDDFARRSLIGGECCQSLSELEVEHATKNVTMWMFSSNTT